MKIEYRINRNDLCSESFKKTTCVKYGNAAETVNYENFIKVLFEFLSRKEVNKFDG